MNCFSSIDKAIRLSKQIILVGVICIVFQAIEVYAQESSYRILITNDDGIDSEGIAALVHEFENYADIVVSAPAENMSCSSHATTISPEPLRVTPYYKDGKLFGYAIKGTPADAVRFGIFKLGKNRAIDLVISGINKGANVGHVAHLSGTVGAAMEALYHGIPALAVSQSSFERNDFSIAAQYTFKIVKQLRQHGIPPGVLLSINVPAGKIKGVVAAKMGDSFIQFSGYEEKQKNAETLSYKLVYHTQQVLKAGTDTKAFQNNFITITPLRFDWTDYQFLNILSNWSLDIE